MPQQLPISAYNLQDSEFMHTNNLCESVHCSTAEACIPIPKYLVQHYLQDTKPETMQMFIILNVYKLWYIHRMEYHSAMKK